MDWARERLEAGEPLGVMSGRGVNEDQIPVSPAGMKERRMEGEGPTFWSEKGQDSLMDGRVGEGGRVVPWPPAWCCCQERLTARAGVRTDTSGVFWVLVVLGVLSACDLSASPTWLPIKITCRVCLKYSSLGPLLR